MLIDSVEETKYVILSLTALLHHKNPRGELWPNIGGSVHSPKTASIW